MKIKNGQIIIYEVKGQYLKYLSKYDNNVRLKSDRRYTGILITDNNKDYCIPLTCQVKKRNSKLTINIKDKNNIIAQLTLNNMIPVLNNEIKIVDISKDKDRDYLNNEISYLRKKDVITAIIDKATNILNVLHNPNHSDYSFFKKLCANYELLEEKSFEWQEVQRVFQKLLHIKNIDNVFYIYDNLQNKEMFEETVYKLDTVENLDKIQNLTADEINNLIKRSEMENNITDEFEDINI